VFILKHHITQKSFAAVHETFSNTYPDKEVPNTTTIHRLVTKFWDTGPLFFEETMQNGIRIF
jgi:hypothetical protein